MRLKIEFPDNLITQKLLAQVRIPCRCLVEADFHVTVSETIPSVTGTIVDWDGEMLDLRVPRYVGGTVSHDAFGLISLRLVGANLYDVIELEMFNRTVGWCPVIADGEYGPPGQFWDEDDGS